MLPILPFVFRLKLSFEEKAHDLEMAKRNIDELSIMLEEKNADTMSEQQHKMQSIAGKGTFINDVLQLEEHS